MEIHFTIGLNFWHFWIFAFTSLPEHWTTIVLSQQHLSYLSGHIISSKIKGFQNKNARKYSSEKVFSESVFYVGKTAFLWLHIIPKRYRVTTDTWNLIIFLSLPAIHLGGIFGGHSLQGLMFHPVIHQVLRHLLAHAVFAQTLLWGNVRIWKTFSKSNFLVTDVFLYRPCISVNVGVSKILRMKLLKKKKKKVEMEKMFTW